MKQFRKNLIEKYGREILKDFQRAYKNPFWTLSDIAKKYGFSRERARQRFEQLYNCKYRNIQKRRMKELNKDLNCIHDPRRKAIDYKKGSTQEMGARAELLVFRKCEDLGYKISPPCTPIYDLEINGFKIDVKSASYAHSFSPKGHVKYFHFRLRKSQFAVCDFIIAYIFPKKTFYIIPIGKLKSMTFYIREIEDYKHPTMPWLWKDKTNYKECKEAWHLLSKQCQGGTWKFVEPLFILMS